MIEIDNIINKAISEGLFPGAALSILSGTAVAVEAYYGRHTFCPWSRVIDASSVFDLASLTKAIGTSLAIAILCQHGRLSFDDALGDIIEDIPEDKARITIGQLMTHSAGLPPWLPIYRICRGQRHVGFPISRQDILKYIVNTPLFYETGTGSVYSDLGFILLGFIVEKLSGMSLGDFLYKYVFSPIKVQFFFGGLSEKCREMAVPSGYCPVRKRMAWAETGDVNAWALGGFLGHAGLFSSLPSLSRLLARLLEIVRGRNEITGWLDGKTLSLMFSSHMPNTPWAIGFDRPTGKDSCAGRFFSKNSVGHLGYTGTSFWMDLDSEIVVIFLSNRTFPFDTMQKRKKMKELRTVLHDRIRVLIG